MSASRGSSRSSQAPLLPPPVGFIPNATKTSSKYQSASSAVPRMPQAPLRFRSLSEETLLKYSTPSRGVAVTDASDLKLPVVRRRSELNYPVGHSYEDLWCRIPKSEIDLSGWLISDRVLEHLASTRMVISSLVLSHAEGFTASGLKRVMAVKGIRECDLSGTIVFDDSAARAIAQAAGSLVSLNLSQCVLTNAAMAVLANSLRNLQTLVLCECDTLSDAMLRSITLLVRRHRKLARLDIAYTCAQTPVEDVMLSLVQYGDCTFKSLKMDGISSVTDVSMVALRRGMRQLTELSISGTEIGDMAVNWVIEGCRALEVLNIANCKRVTNDSLSSVGKTLLRLRSLNISGCSQISDAGLKDFTSAFFGRLEALDCSRCTAIAGAGLEALSTKAQHLKRLYMNDLPNVDATSVAKLVRACLALECFEVKIQLKAAATHRFSRFSKMNDEALAAFTSAHLLELQLHGACNITDKGMKALSEHCQKLVKLDVSHCHRITDAALLSLSQHLHLLEEVKLAGCFEVTDNGLVPLVQNCVRIRALNISGCRKITNASIHAASMHLKQLARFSLACCDGVNTDGVLAIAANAPNLVTLDLSGLHDVEEEAIQQVVQNCRWLTRLAAPICAVLSPASLAMIDRHEFMTRSDDPKRQTVLVAKPRPVLSYNRFVIGYEKYEKAARVLQHYFTHLLVPRSKAAKLKAFRRQKLEHAVLQWEYLTTAMLENTAKMRLFRRFQAANVIQKVWRRSSAAKAARAIEAKKWRRLHAATAIQSLYRRYRSKQLLMRLVYRHAAIKQRWLYLLSARRYQWHLVHHMQQTKRRWVKAQTAVRAYLVRKRYKGWLQKQRTLVQSRTKKLLVCYQSHMVIRSMYSRLEDMQAATLVIGQWYQAIKDNCTIRKRATQLAIAYRDRYELMENAIITIIRARRAYAMNFVINRRIAITRKNNRAARAIQMCWRSFRLRCRAERTHAHWKRLILWIAQRYKTKCLCILNELDKERRLRKAKYQAVIRVQCAVRRYQARCTFLRIQLHKRQVAAARIQTIWWVYQWRQWRKYERQRQIHAAWTIHKYYRAHQHQLRYANKYVRRHVAAEIRNAEFKAAAIRNRRERIVNQIYQRQLHRHARKVQRCFRRRQERQREREELEQLDRLNREALQDAQQAMTLAASKNVSVGPMPAVVHRDAKMDAAEKEQLLKAVVQHHNLSVRQLGVVDIELTVGDKATQLFAQQQTAFRKGGQSYFTRATCDLSGSSGAQVYLWYKIGEGSAMFTNIHCHRMPRLSREAMHARQLKYSMEHVKLVWNARVQFELRAVRGIMAGEQWVAIQSLVVVDSEDSETLESLQQQRFELIASLAEYGLPTELWMKRSIPPVMANQLAVSAHGLMGLDWFNARIHHTMSAYVLAPADVLQMREVFTVMAGAHAPTGVPATKLSELWRVPHTPFVGWYLHILGAESTRRFVFSEYLHLVCSFCMASEPHLCKLVFRMGMAKADVPWLEVDDLQKLFDVLYELDVRNFYSKLSASREFAKYTPHPHMMYRQFAELAKRNPMLLYSLTRLQHTVREQNMGTDYWLTKLDKFSQIRDEFQVLDT